MEINRNALNQKIHEGLYYKERMKIARSVLKNVIHSKIWMKFISFLNLMLTF